MDMDILPLDFIGWFYAVACAAAILGGVGILIFLENRGQLTTRYQNYSIWNDVMLMVIWAIGLGGAIGVLYRNPWGQWMLQLFCWMLIALAVTSGATRLFTLKRIAKGNLSPGDWTHSVIGVVMVIVPIVIFCLGTIVSLRTDEALAAFGIH